MSHSKKARLRPARLDGAAPAAKRPRWGLRLLLALAGPALFLLGFEGALRVAGYGYPTAFFLSREVNGQSAWVDNWQFGWRFFPRALARQPHPLVMARQKPAQTIRIFVLGESAALGVPAPEYGFSRMLGVLLRERFRGRKFEVVNVSMVAINSHAIVPIARECARREGDLWVVYMGNNEVIGPFGAHEVLGAAAPPPWVIWASLTLKTTRFGQLLDAGQQWLKGRAGRAPQWQGMQMWKSAIARDDARIGRVQEHFRRNLERLLQAGRQVGVPIILSTVACNLRDCSPFASLHRRGLSPAEQAEWERAYQAGLVHEAGGEMAEALAQYLQAARLDDRFAELQFRLGACCFALGQTNNARSHFRQAKDEDALQFRPDSRLNDALRKAAAAGPARQVRLLDAEELLARNSPGGLPGEEMFYEHVHLKPAGNYLLARATAELAAGMIPAGASPAGTAQPGRWLSEAECEARLGLTDWGRLRSLEVVQGMLFEPPFTAQSIHSNQVQRVGSQLKRLGHADDFGALRTSLRQVQAAVESDPSDAELLQVLAPMLEQAGDAKGAEQRWREVIHLIPQAPIPYLNLARLLRRQGRDEEAALACEECLRRDYDNHEAHGDLGALLLRRGRAAEALPHLRVLVERQPGSALGHWVLGQALLQLNRPREAVGQFEEVLRLDPSRDEARQALNDLQINR